MSIEATMYIVRSFHIRWWRRINSLVLTFLCFTLAYHLLGNKFWLQDYRKTAKSIGAICIGIGLINMNVLDSSMFWITGSFNYLWPITAGCLAMIPFRERLIYGPFQINLKNLFWFLFPPLATIFAGLGNEQVALTILILMIVLNITLYGHTKKIDFYLLAMTLIVAISFAISWTAPGNQIRYARTIELNFPHFNDMTLIQHLLLGLSWLLDKIVNLNRVLLIALFALIALSLRHHPTSRMDTALSNVAIFIASFILISSLQLNYLHPEFQSWIHERFYTFNELADFIRAFEKLERNYNFNIILYPILDLDSCSWIRSFPAI